MHKSIAPVVCALAVISCLPLTCFGRDATEYELDETSFKADTLATIQEDSGIQLPPGARGLKYHYKPPIDPTICAKIEIPAAAEKQMEARIAALADDPDFPPDSANDRCRWWPSKPAGAIVSRKALRDRLYIEVHLVREGARLVLFLKYFTI